MSRCEAVWKVTAEKREHRTSESTQWRCRFCLSAFSPLPCTFLLSLAKVGLTHPWCDLGTAANCFTHSCCKCAALPFKNWGWKKCVCVCVHVSVALPWRGEERKGIALPMNYTYWAYLAWTVLKQMCLMYSTTCIFENHERCKESWSFVSTLPALNVRTKDHLMK